MITDAERGSFLQSRGFRELTGVLIILFALGVVVLAIMSQKPKSKRIMCVNNLKQVGLGLRMWANDSSDEFPMQASTNRGGTLEWFGSKEVYRHFLAASNEIGNPKILICPADKERRPATNFTSLRNQNLSYWLELNAKEAVPVFLFVGDRHLNTNGVLLPNGCDSIVTQQALGWGPGLHDKEGNVGLTDGSVQQVDVVRLARLQAAQQVATNWLAIP